MTGRTSSATPRQTHIDPSQVTVVPVDFDPTPLMKGDVDGFMAYLTNEAISVASDGYDPRYGARHVQRSIERLFLEELARRGPGAWRVSGADGSLAWSAVG